MRRSMAAVDWRVGRADRDLLDAGTDAKGQRMAADDTVSSDEALERGQVVDPASTGAEDP